jgi:hypothetical protein
MPLISPLLEATLRRQWPAVGAALVFVIFTLANLVWVRPLEQRYHRLVEQAARLGMAVDPETTPRTMSPALMALLAGNSMEAGTAEAQANSGQLTAALLADLTRLAARNGMEVLAADQGPVTQQPAAIQVRAHLKVRGQYRGLLGWLRDLAGGGRLDGLERFAAGPLAGGRQTFDFWVSRLVLKQKPRGGRS